MNTLAPPLPTLRVRSVRIRALAVVAMGLALSACVPAVPAEAKPLRVLAIGDSITKLEGGYRAELASLMPIQWVGPYRDSAGAHGAISGITVGRIGKRAVQWCRTYKPDLVLIMLGSNDARLATPVPTFERQYRALLTRCGKRVVFARITPRYRDGEAVRPYNEVLMVMGAIRMPALTETQTVDGVHPNAEGRRLIAEAWHRWLS